MDKLFERQNEQNNLKIKILDFVKGQIPRPTPQQALIVVHALEEAALIARQTDELILRDGV